jgi:hypothetical protein
MMNIRTNIGSKSERSLPAKSWRSIICVIVHVRGKEDANSESEEKRREELILTAWHRFPVHEDEQNRGYFRKFQWHDLTLR